VQLYKALCFCFLPTAACKKKELFAGSSKKSLRSFALCYGNSTCANAAAARVTGPSLPFIHLFKINFLVIYARGWLYHFSGTCSCRFCFFALFRQPVLNICSALHGWFSIDISSII